MADRHDFRKIIAELAEVGIGHGKIALLLNLHPTQVKRISEHGRCQHWIGEMLIEIHREYVPRETSQIVIRTQAFIMQTA